MQFTSLMPPLFAVFLILFVGFVNFCFFLLWQRYQYFNQRNIPTPPFVYFFGHLKILWNSTSFYRQLESWTKQYGKIYGIYQGSSPTLIVSDPDFLQEVFIKQFANFHGRREVPMISRNRNVFTAWGAQWHRHRHIINPTFSSVKLKLMSPLINECIDNAMKKISDHATDGNEFNIYMYYKRMTMDVICRCAFGIDTDLQNNPNNIYFQKVEEIFACNIRTSFIFKLTLLIPELTIIIGRIASYISTIQTWINTHVLPLISNRRLYELPGMWLLNRLSPIIDERQKTPTSRVDVLQLMMQAMIDEQETNKAQYQLTRDEIISNILAFMAAGYETTATALAYATYMIAKHPEVQEKLRAEIDRLSLKDDEIYPDYDIIAQMTYMNMFVMEVLRMHPIALAAVQRRAFENTVIQGIQISKGMRV